MKKAHSSLIKVAMVSVLLIGLSGCISTLCSSLLTKGGTGTVPICGT